MEHRIEMEERSCPVCGRKFRVMSSSQHKACSHYCTQYGLQGRTAPKNQSIAGEKKIVNVTVQNINQKSLEKKNQSEENLSVLQTLKKTMQGGENTMQTIKSESSSDEPFGESTIQNKAEPQAAETITKTEKRTVQKNESAETSAIQPELSEGSLESLKREGLNSMRLLDKSANRLMQLMESCVPDEDLDRAMERVQNVNPDRIDAALRCANALSQTIQTKVNIFKAVGSLMKDK